MGKMASGGIKDTAATKGARVTRTYGSTPRVTPNAAPMNALIANAIKIRSRLARVSVQKRIVAAPLVFFEGVAMQRRRDGRGRGQQLVAGVRSSRTLEL